MAIFNLNIRHCEERSDEAIQASDGRLRGLLRFARNDGGSLARGIVA